MSDDPQDAAAIDKESKPGLFSSSVTLLSISTVYLYFLGYLFSFYYFRAFGITLESLDLPLQSILMNSYKVLQTAEGTIIAIGVIIVILLYFRGTVSMGLLIAAMLGAFPLLAWAADTAGNEAIFHAKCHPSLPIQLVLKDPGAELGLTYTFQRIPIPEYLLAETKDRIVVYEQAQCLPDLGPSAVHVHTILRSDLKYFTIVAQ